MSKPIQKRTLATRAKLISSAQKAISSNGFGAMRVEDVVQDAGVAKGTFFAHFRDKDALMDLIIGGKLNGYLDEIDALIPPQNVEDMIQNLMPILNFMSSDQYIFNLILRHSGAAAKEDIGPIALTFDRQIVVLAKWLSHGPFRKDVSALILAEGVQAFTVQCLGLHFCAVHGEEPIQKRLKTYLDAWLKP